MPSSNLGTGTYSPTLSTTAPGEPAPALTGQRVEISGIAGRLNVYEQGAGAPLLLVHSVNAAASAAEVRPLYNRYAATRRTFALDLPGFGFSDRSNRPYTVRLMTDAIHDVCAHIRTECGHVPIDALGVSLSCEFLARAAVEGAPFRSLTFVSPTGFSRRPRRSDSRESSHDAPWQHKWLVGPGWGRAIYRTLTHPSLIRFFLRRTWGSAHIDEQLWRYDVLTAEQPGAEHAPLYFLSGALFSRDILSFYEQLDMPVWMCKGLFGEFDRYPYAASVDSRDNWRHSTFATGALPHFEKPDAFCLEYDCFLERAKAAPIKRSAAEL